MKDLEDPTIDDQVEVSCLIVNNSPPVSVRSGPDSRPLGDDRKTAA